MKFPNTDRFLQLHELEQSFRSSVVSINKDATYIRSNYKYREVGRAWGFFTCAEAIKSLIERNDKSICVGR
jgi:hypothetical protein